MSASAGGQGNDWRTGPVAALALFAVCLFSSIGTLEAADLEDLLLDLQVVPLDGEPPPTFALDDLKGKKISLSDFRGRVVLLYFWATW